jgi:hypothetical protein
MLGRAREGCELSPRQSNSRHEIESVAERLVSLKPKDVAVVVALRPGALFHTWQLRRAV